MARAELAGHDRLISGQLTTTDDRGRYRLANLPPGRYLIEVPGAYASSASQPNDPTGPPNRLQLEHFPVPPPVATPMTYPSTYFPGVTGLGEASPIEVAVGEERGSVDVSLSPTSAVSISGRLDGSAESSQPMRVRLIPDGAEDLALGPDIAQAMVGRDGRFRFGEVPPGNYTMEASRVIGAFTQNTGEDLDALLPGLLSGVNRSRDLPFASQQVRFSWSAIDPAERLMIARQQIAVGARDVTGVVLSMESAGTMRGVVRQRLVPGVPKPQTAPTVGIFCDPADGAPILGLPIQELDPSQAGESFAMSGLRPGRYFVRVAHGWTVDRIVWNGQDYTDRPFDAAATRDFADVEVVVTNAGASLTGVVRDGTGLLVPRGTVLVMPDQAALRADFGLWPTRFRVVAIAAGGRFMTSDLPAGTYRVVALPTTVTVRLTPSFLESVAPTAMLVTLTTPQQQNVNLVVQEVRR